MSINLLFKIAAVGILVSVLGTGFKACGKGGTGLFNQSCRIAFGVVLDCSLHIGAV